MKTTEIAALFMLIAVVSFLGFVVENIWLWGTKGYIDNRNMCLPFLIGYGLAIVAIHALFGTPSQLILLGKRLGIRNKIVKKMLYFLMVFVCVCVGEILLGTLVEKTCHFYWWDYSKLPLHITRYTSIPTSTAFAVMIVIFMDYIYEPLYMSFMRWEPETLCRVAPVMMLTLLVDYIYNAYRMYKEKKMTPRWRIDTTSTKGYQLLHCFGAGR